MRIDTPPKRKVWHVVELIQFESHIIQHVPEGERRINIPLFVEHVTTLLDGATEPEFTVVRITLPGWSFDIQEYIPVGHLEQIEHAVLDNFKKAVIEPYQRANP